MTYRLTRKAAEDLGEIYVDGVHQCGSRQADHYHDLHEKTFRFLAINPHAARLRPELSPAIRIHPVQSHLVSYRIEEDGQIRPLRRRLRNAETA
jgi:toxin ParE1/3/4